KGTTPRLLFSPFSPPGCGLARWRRWRSAAVIARSPTHGRPPLDFSTVIGFVTGFVTLRFVTGSGGPPRARLALASACLSRIVFSSSRRLIVLALQVAEEALQRRCYIPRNTLDADGFQQPAQ